MKKLILSALLGAAGQLALAQSATAIYGVADMGLVLERGGAASSINKLTSGIGYGSRIGFRGTEDLGGGLSAKYVLEAGILMDTGASAQGGLLFGRQAYVGLGSQAGSVTLGRQYTPYYWNLLTVADPFLTGYAGTAANLMANTGGRANNMMLYTSPTIGGVTGELAYAFGEVAGDSAASRAIGGAIGYSGGPLNVKLAYHNANNATATDSTRNTLLAGNYDFGIAKAHLAYAWNKGPSTSDSNDLLIGATIPFGPHKVLASYIVKNDKSAANRDASQAAIGYIYSVSKRTELYTAYAKINNRNGAAFIVGNGTELGSGNQAFNVGVRHFF